MHKRLFRLVLCLCLLAGSVLTPIPRATADIELPPATSTDIYEGIAVWQRPDGSTLRGSLYLVVEANDSTRSLPNGRKLDAQFDFNDSAMGASYSYYFQGKMDPNGRGFLRYKADVARDYPLPLPALNPGKVSVQITLIKDLYHSVISGGVLAADGTQLTFRADFVTGYATL